MDAIEQLLMSLPKATLSIDRDRRIREAILSAPTPTPPPQRAWWSRARPNALLRDFGGFAVPRFAIASLVLVLVLVGTSGYAYASPSVTRGQPLYVVKRGVERAMVVWPRGASERVRLHTAFALRRAAEIEVLVGARESTVSATAADLAAETATAVRVAESITDVTAARRAVESIADGQARARDRLLRAARTAGLRNPRNAEAIARAMSVVDATAIASRAAAEEAQIAAARGDLTVRLAIAPRRIRPEDARGEEQLTEALSDERSELPTLRSSLSDAGTPDADADALVGQIQEKLDRADTAIRSGKQRQAARAIETAKALRTQARHLVNVAEQDEVVRNEVEEVLAGTHEALDEIASRIEVLQDIQPDHRIVRSAVAFLETARARLAEADAAFAVGADARARAQAELAQELLDRLGDRLSGWDWGDEGELNEDENEDKDEGKDEDEDGSNRGDGALERTRGWGGAVGSPPAVDPQTNIRYEFKDEYLRPLAW